MRHGSSRRQRNNRGNSQRRAGGNKSKVFDSNGPEVRIRGTAFQVTEKYTALAKDAAAAGDRILEQSYLQHAEHYQRVISSWELDNPSAQSGQSEQSEQSGNRNSRGQRQNTRTDGNKSSGEDLGLPSSILRPAPEVSSEDVITEGA
ncbi:DUF4167 domain-containing protein [Alphaproteobacteria bacterium]|nr:DUF4167 domain-containing protein [Alphaproteobacteria bacterium]